MHKIVMTIKICERGKEGAIMKKVFRSKYLSKDYNLPDFVKNSPHYHAHFEEEIEIVKNQNGKWGIRYEDEKRTIYYDYDTFFEAYYDNKKHGCCTWFSDEIAHEIFGTACSNEEDERNDTSNIADIFFGKKCGHRCYRHFSRHHGDFTIKRLVDDYEEWLEKDKLMDDKSFTVENITEIYDWLNTHVDFWLEKKMGDRYSWNTENGVASTWARPVKVDIESRKIIEEYAPDYRTRPYETEWWIEGGLHVINEENDERYCVENYHDLALDDVGATYDEAFINFARNVWLQAQGMLKDREEKRNKYLDKILEGVEDYQNG
jgi:hypothetical protein